MHRSKQSGGRGSWSILLLLAITMAMLTGNVSIAQFPADFGPNLHRVASTRSWLVYATYYEAYDWLPDRRLLIWIGTDDHPRACLLDPKTGKQEALALFNKLVFSAAPPKTATRMLYLTPDGKSLLSHLGNFTGPSTFLRILSLDGCWMHLYPLSRHFAWSGSIAWEWNERSHGWATFGSYNNLRTARVEAVAHFDLANPEQPRIVELPDTVLPDWTAPNIAYVDLMAVTPTGEGMLGPHPGGLNYYPQWSKQHQVPLSVIDIEEGKRPPRDYLVSIPKDAKVETYVFSPDASHIAWQLRFHRPHPVPGHSARYATDEIWISDQDGSHLHRLGYQAARFDNIAEGLHFLAWKDNQTLSFLHDQALYTLPIR